MKAPVKILILEDNPRDVELLFFALRKAGLAFTSKVVQTRAGFERALEGLQPDIVLSDHNLPSFDGLSAFQLLREKTPATPFIVLSGAMDEAQAAHWLRLGVSDVASKGELDALVEKIMRVLKGAGRGMK